MHPKSKKYPDDAKTWTNEFGELVAVWSDERGHLMVYHSDPLISKSFRFYPEASRKIVELARRAAEESGVSLPEEYLSGTIAGLGGTSGKWILQKDEVEFILRCARELGVE